MVDSCNPNWEKVRNMKNKEEPIMGQLESVHVIIV